MKAENLLLPEVAGLRSWLLGNGWSYSLVIGATCGCDVSRLGREICDRLNVISTETPGTLRSFDRDEIRRLAGNSVWRDQLAENAGLLPVKARACDFERTAAAIAAIGGAVLSGQCCLDATRALPNVFRVMISCCGRCKEDDPMMRLHSARFSDQALVQVIGDSFLNWCRDRGEPSEGRPSRAHFPGGRIRIGTAIGEHRRS